jgi:hypothetical protein
VTEISLLKVSGPALMRPADAAETIGISEAAVRDLVARGDLCSVRVLDERLIPVVEVADFLDRLGAT